MPPRLQSGIASIALACTVTFLSLVAGEAAFRALDGYLVFSLQLVQDKPVPQQPTGAAAGHLNSIPLAEGMKTKWFFESPKPLPRGEVPPALLQATEQYSARGIASESVHVLNWAFAKDRVCRDDLFLKFPGFIFAFDAPNERAHPRYRFPRSVTTPAGMVTNQFGWRGPQIELHKPQRTIRIAFVGASTTVNDHSFPFSYPELAVFWLNMWARGQGLNVNIEVANAGREGISSTDIAAIVRQEVLPIEPDLIVYYEGSNQINPGSIVKYSAGKPSWFDIVPRASVASAAFFLGTQPYSAFARRFAQAIPTEVAEPSKPDYPISWPADVDENDPPLQHSGLPANLSTILKDIENIRTAAASDGSELVLSSFFWLVWEGMKIDPVRSRTLYNYLNYTFYPFHYREMERLATFQNRVLRKYASAHGLELIDIATQMPRDPILFSDAIHGTYEAIRLHAWIAAQALSSILRRRIDEGRLPRASHAQLGHHPAFPGHERTIVFDCDARPASTEILASLDLSSGVQKIAPAEVQPGQVLRVRAAYGSEPNRYLAQILPPSLLHGPAKDLALTVELKVAESEIGIGVLSADQTRFLGYRPIQPTDGFISVNILFSREDTGLGPIVIANGSPSNHGMASVEVKAMTISAGNLDLFARTYAEGLVVPSLQ